MPEARRASAGVLAQLSLTQAHAKASPIPYHLRPSDQQIVGIPAESFLNGTDIAWAFEQLPEVFTIENGIRVYLYRKTRPIAPEEVEPFSERLRAAYPDRPEFYRP